MWDFVTGIFDTVVNWVTDSAGEAVGAVAGRALQGAAAGAIIGAATAAIRGDDILDGALSGAAVGGITAGVFSGIGQLTGLSTAEEQLASMVGSPAQELGEDIAVSQEPGLVSPRATTSAGAEAGILSREPAQAKKWLTPETAEIIGGVGSGAAQGALGYLAAGETAEAQKEMVAEEEAAHKARILANQPGQFAAQTAKIDSGTWWEDHIKNLNVVGA